MTAKLHGFQLEKLADLVSLPRGKAAMYMEACIWCMDQNGHINGADIDVLFEKKNHIYQISWADQNIDIPKIRAHYNIDDALPFGAEAIAFFVCITNTDYDYLNRAIRKTGIDYWLGHKNSNDKKIWHCKNP